jgi:hypothetical protein
MNFLHEIYYINNVDIIVCLIAIKTITATTNIKYKLWLQRLDIQTNNISISVSLGFQKQFVSCKTQQALKF